MATATAQRDGGGAAPAHPRIAYAERIRLGYPTRTAWLGVLLASSPREDDTPEMTCKRVLMEALSDAFTASVTTVWPTFGAIYDRLLATISSDDPQEAWLTMLEMVIYELSNPPS